MRTHKSFVNRALVLSVVVLLLPAHEASADAPALVNYQGILMNGAGVPQIGIFAVTFAVYATPTGGVALWSEGHSITTDNDGRFSILLGGSTIAPVPLLDNVFAGMDRYLGITVGADPEMSPRTRFASVAFAHRISTVDGATGGHITSAVTIGSGHTNTGTAAFVTGEDNEALAQYSTVSGRSNTASGDYSVVAGGFDNTASALTAVVGGGVRNLANGDYSFIGSGYENQATGTGATVAGGVNDSALIPFSSVGGGGRNKANGWAATIPGGVENLADGDYSFAAGLRANAIHNGSFVWVGNVSETAVSSDYPYQFKIDASSGVRIASEAGSAKTISFGDHYSDNGIIAWAKVFGGTGNMAGNEFGVTSVTRNSVGNYTVLLDDLAETSAQVIPVASLERAVPPTSAATVRLLFVNQINQASFDVYVVDGNYAAADNNFMFIVTGRP